MDRARELTENFMATLPPADCDMPNLLQAVREVALDVLTVEKNNADWTGARVLQRLVEPDRIISFRVTWMNDAGEVEINRGWRVQASNVLGPYKGGLRFHPQVQLDDLRFLAFEQCFKNALTGLPLGGAKGGSDFDPAGRSNTEIMRFCQAFMAQLCPHIGPDRDVPAGDINVGTREIGYLFGAWRARQGVYSGALTGKNPVYGGSEMRVQATGFGLVYFVCKMLERRGKSMDGLRVAVSGRGNVASHAAQKAIEAGARVVTLSHHGGTLYAPDGLTKDALDWACARKSAGQDLSGPPKSFKAEYHENTLPWAFESDIGLPCATQNEMDGDAAEAFVDNGGWLLAEGANMPTTPEARQVLDRAGVLFAPAKAANAGGVAISGLEMSQMSHRRFMSPAELDKALRDMMCDIHDRVAAEGQEAGKLDYARGANLSAYRRLATAITEQGVV